MLFLSELPPSRGQLELILHKSNKKEAEQWSYRADVPHPACGSGSDCRKSPFLHTQSRGRPPGGNHTDAWGGPKTPLESRASAVTAWTPPMIPWPYEGDRLNKGQKEDFIHKHLKAIQILIVLGFKEKCKTEFSYQYITPQGWEEWKLEMKWCRMMTFPGIFC